MPGRRASFRASYADGKDFRFPTTAPGRLIFAESNSSVHPEEQPEGGTIWHHLERHGIPFRNYGEGFELAGVDEGEGLKPTGGALRDQRAHARSAVPQYVAPLSGIQHEHPGPVSRHAVH